MKKILKEAAMAVVLAAVMLIGLPVIVIGVGLEPAAEVA